jgi:hypothetical protein
MMKKQISATYQELTGKTLESKQLHYWEQAITNNAATIDTFIQNVVNEDDYIDCAYKLFLDVLNDTVKENNINAKTLFDPFWQTNKGKRITREMCRSYICKCPFYEQYISNVIDDIFNFEMNRSPTADELARYVSLAIEKYDTQDLINEIIYYKQHQHYSTEAQVQPPISPENTVFDKDVIDMFEDIFNRPMYVQEYFKYDKETNFEELFTAHNLSYNKLRSIFQNYTGKSISEYYYVKKYLYKIDDPNFYKTIVDDIVGSQEYRQGMQKVLMEKYQTLYDQQLYGADIDYIFNIVKEKKLDIVTDELDLVLERLKEETDEIMSYIFKVYMDVLERPPEIAEIEKYTTYFRERKDQQTLISITANIEKTLIKTLEFHDIIKKHIKIIYSQNKGKEITHGVMYEILNNVIHNIDDVTMSTLSETIALLI